tara:strand:+ start:133 stop:363 length:231 start_codon:yes stop_codon:yes gene_type:complete
MSRYTNAEDLNHIIITDGLLKELHEIFPDSLPSKLVSEPELCKLIGQQQVIRWLKDKQEEIKEASYKGDKTSVRVT